MSECAGYDLATADIKAARFVNGLDTHLFRVASDMESIYLKPFYAIFGILQEEYDIEFAMRKKYCPDTRDSIICGAITDEWRIARYMHASHASIENGEFFRFAGNTVFPNGFIDMELARPANGGKLVIYGDTTETANFRIELDGAAPADAVFNADGVAEFAIPGGNDPVRVKLTKATGTYYPRFRAIITK